MSLDEEAEDNVYAALKKVHEIPRLDTREKIFKGVVHRIMMAMGWSEVTIKQNSIKKEGE